MALNRTARGVCTPCSMVYRYRGAGLGAESVGIAEPLGPRSGRAVRRARRGVKSSRGGARGAGRASRRGVPARFRLRGSAFPPAPRAARPAGSRAETRRGRLPGRGHSLARSRSQGRAQGRGVRGPSEAGPRVQGQEGPGVACRTATPCAAQSAGSTVSSLKATLNEFQELDRKPQMRETSSAPSSLAIVRHPHP